MFQQVTDSFTGGKRLWVLESTMCNWQEKFQDNAVEPIQGSQKLRVFSRDDMIGCQGFGKNYLADE